MHPGVASRARSSDPAAAILAKTHIAKLVPLQLFILDAGRGEPFRRFVPTAPQNPDVIAGVLANGRNMICSFAELGLKILFALVYSRGCGITCNAWMQWQGLHDKLPSKYIIFYLTSPAWT